MRNKLWGVGIAVVAAIILTPQVASAATTTTPSVETPGGVRVLLNPVTIGSCNSGLGEVSVQRMQAVNDGTIDLFCGDSKSGYVHIRTRHQKDWQAVIDKTHGGGTLWDDSMVASTSQIVSHPSAGYPKPEGNGKLCYTAPIVIHDPETKTVSTYNPTVIVSQNRKLVITSFPTNASPNCTGDSAQHARGEVALHLTPRGDHETRSHVRREARADPLR